jgi:alpha-beta hydrolase superfamily lysophospholipase
MARTILAKYPESGISAAVICGTGWLPKAPLPALIKVVEGICKKNGQENPSEQLQGMVFGGYNKKIANPRTSGDWLTRDEKIVDAYVAHPLCGFTPACGLLRDMMKGIYYIEQSKNLKNMKKHRPVFFIAGAEDPVGPYGKGVEQAVKEFKKAGMINVACKIYPDCRHEILNELNKEEVYEDVVRWMAPYVTKE